MAICIEGEGPYMLKGRGHMHWREGSYALEGPYAWREGL